MLVEKITYGTLSAGNGAGFIGFQITLGGEGKEVSPQEIIKKITTLQKTAFPKLVRFIIGDEIDEGQTLALVKTLIDWGYSIQTVTTGEAWHPFMGHTYNIVRLTSPSWLGFVCNELWFALDGGEEELSDPILPGGKIEGCLYYILPTDGLWNYMLSSSLPWAILPKPAKNLLMEVEI